MLKKMKKQGIKIGIGTDLVVDWINYMPHAYIDELKSLVEIGYTNSEALVAATKTSAEILRMDDRLGTIQTGKLADIIVLNGRPDENLDDLGKVDMVIINGRTILNAGQFVLPLHEPVDPPKKQIGEAKVQSF